MAVFLVNNCTFRGCSQKYSSLRELIQHIEAHHIVSDPQALERQELQQPSSLALSYVLRLSVAEAATAAKLQVRQRKNSLSPVPSLSSYRSSTPTGSEFDDEERQSDNSDDSWVTQEEITSDIILGMMSSHKEADSEKPFVCPVPGCKKRYKNINGIKYHAKHGHRKDIRVKKPFRCKCGKSYSSASGLRHHSAVAHHTSSNHSNHPNNHHSQPPQPPPPVIAKATQPAPPQHFIKTVEPLIISAPNTNNNTTAVVALSPLPGVLPTKPAQTRAALPLGSLTFQTPSGDIQVAVPVSRVLGLGNGLDSTTKMETWGGGILGGVGGGVCSLVGSYESVETFNGLETSVDEMKAD